MKSISTTMKIRAAVLHQMKGESFEEGFQSVPVDWGINSDRKKGFFNLLKEMTSVENR